MLDNLKQRWQHFVALPSGQRFQGHYQRHQQSRPRTLHRKILAIGGGILIMGIGVVFLPAPGPGALILLIGAALIAEESLLAARILDKIELRVQPLVNWLGQLWQRYRAR